MADAVIGALRVVLGADSAAFEKQMNTIAGKLEGIGGRIAGIGAVITAGVTTPLLLLAKKSFAAFEESDKAVKKLEAALKSTGGTVGYTSAQLQEMAAQLQKITTFDDDDILGNVTSTLLRFGEITGKTFKAAQVAVLDVATAMKMDLASAATLVGKALNNPAKAFGALRKAGISFSEAQKKIIEEMVKTGRTAEAQKEILKGFAEAFGGQAAALAATADGKWTQAFNAIGDAMESVGEQIAPFVGKFADFIKSLADSFNALAPSTKEFIVVMGAVAAAIGPVLVVLGALVAAIGAVGLPVAAVVIAIGALVGAFVLLGGGDSKAEKAAKLHTQALDELAQAIDDVKNKIPGARQELEELRKKHLQSAYAAIADAKAQIEMGEALKSFLPKTNFPDTQFDADAQRIGNQQIKEGNEALALAKKRLQELEDKINGVTRATPEMTQGVKDASAATDGLADRDLRGWSESFSKNVRFVGEELATTSANVRKVNEELSALPVPTIGSDPAKPSALLANWQKLQADIVPVFEAIKASALAFSQAVGPIFTETENAAKGALVALANGIKELTAGFIKLRVGGVSAMEGIARAAKQWLEIALGQAIDYVMRKINELIAKFREMKDKVVAHSYIPDMVIESEVWLKRLSKTMPALAQKAADNTAAAFENMNAAKFDPGEVTATKTIVGEMADSGGQGQAQPVNNFYSTVTIKADDPSTFTQAKQQIIGDLSDMFAGARLRPA